MGVHNARGEGVLRVEWPGGRVQRLGHGLLRAACPCSQCRARRLRGGLDLVAEGVRIQRILPQGYGVQLVFDDGHERGIYPWAYLQGLGTAGDP
nr:gamma-butyrobetaine hydroxylase-like domain-containing protein [Pseudomonas sp. RIT-PI-AD]